MNIFIVAQQMFILFAMIAMGILLSKLGWITADSSSKMSKMVVNIFNAFLTIDSVNGQSLQSTGNVFWQNLVLVFIYYTVLFLAGWVIVLIIRPCRIESAMYRMLTLFPNCGFMGIPIVTSLLGKEYVIYVAVYMLIYNLIIYTYGVQLMCSIRPELSKSREKDSFLGIIRTIFINPGVIASIAALLIFFCNIQLPASIATFCTYMGNPCIPVSMLLIGYSIANANLEKILKSVRMYIFLFLKMLILPIACSLLIRFLPFDSTISILFLILIAMPTGSMTVMIAQKYNIESDMIAGGVVLSTIVSLITLPLVSIFL